jgi:hypothetical protein
VQSAPCARAHSDEKSGPAGPTGPTGPTGENGQLRIFSDGSAGVLAVTTGASLLGRVPDATFQFTDATISAGAIRTVPSGTLLRCTGTFTNNGTIVVQTGERCGDQVNNPGVAHLPADNGGSGPDTDDLGARAGGIGLTTGEAIFLLDVNPAARPVAAAGEPAAVSSPPRTTRPRLARMATPGTAFKPSRIRPPCSDNARAVL